MAEGDIRYLRNNNVDCEIEDADGVWQRASLVAAVGGFGFGSLSDDNPVPVKAIENSKPAVEHFMWEELNDVTIVSATLDGKTVTLDPGHGFLNPVGLDVDYLNIHYVNPLDPSFVGVRFSQHNVISVTGDNIEITPPLGYALIPVDVESSKRVNVNMNVLGTRANPVEFQSYPPNGQIWDLRRMIPDMILTSAGDDGLFGNIEALTNGEYFGFEGQLAGVNFYILSIFDNGSFRATGYDVTYVPRSGGGGTQGMAVRKTFAGLEKSGVIVKVNGATDDRAVKITQDDLTGLARYRIKLMGDISDDSTI